MHDYCHREIRGIRERMEIWVSVEMKDPRYVYTMLKYLQMLIFILCVSLVQGMIGTKGELGDKGEKAAIGQKGFKVNVVLYSFLS